MMVCKPPFIENPLLHELVNILDGEWRGPFVMVFEIYVLSKEV